MKIVDDAQEELLNSSQKELADLFDSSKLSPALQVEARAMRERVLRRMRQFDSSIIVIISAGMLKAGKSTLVNLLARTPNASPVGYGFDTTLRPALIKMAPEGEKQGHIDVYDAPGNATFEEINKALGDVLDQLRGLPVQKARSARSFPLTQRNLINALCNTPGTSDSVLNAEPLLVVVETPYNAESKLLAQGCMLMDMPGLDSANADVTKLTEKYQAIINECDLLLFVQSSVAPLNQRASEYLCRLKELRSSATYRVIQNKMEAKHWLRKEVLGEQNDQQAKHAESVFKNMTGVDTLHIDNVNLGMAFDACLGKGSELGAHSDLLGAEPLSRELLMSSSGFLPMEDNLLADLQENGAYNRMLYCFDELNNELNRSRKKLESELILRTESEQNEARAALKDWEKMAGDIANMSADYNFLGNPQFSLDGSFFAALESELKAAYRQAQSNKQALVSECMDGSRIDELLDECNDLARKCARIKLAGLTIGAVRDGNGVAAITMINEEMKRVQNCISEEMSRGGAVADCYKHIFGPMHWNSSINADHYSLSHLADDFESFFPNRYRKEKGTLVKLATFGMKQEASYSIDPRAPIWNVDLDEMTNFYCQEVKKRVREGVKSLLVRIIRDTIRKELEPAMTKVAVEQKNAAARVSTLQRDLSSLQELERGLSQIREELKPLPSL